MKSSTLITDEALIALAERYIEDSYAAVGTTIFYYEDCDDPDDDSSCYVSAESLPRSDEDCNQWAELTDLVITSAEVSKRDDRRGEYSATVTAEVTWVSYSDSDEGTEETSFRELYVFIYQQDGRLYVDQVEE